MKKLKYPKNPHRGLKIFCHRCKRDNPKCNHYDVHKYKVVIHVEGGCNKKKTKVLNAIVYEDAVKEAIEFRKELEQNNFERVSEGLKKTDYTMLAALIEYQRYLSGKHRYSHLVKDISNDYQDECMRYCKHFFDNIKEHKNVKTSSITTVDQIDVSRFYTWAKSHYGAKSFNKCLSEIKAFFKFIITVEKIVMENPFAVYNAKKVVKSNIATLEKAEFMEIVKAVKNESAFHTLKNGQGEIKNMYRSYLVDGFKIALLTGLRREEIVVLRWSDIFISVKGIMFFMVSNIKVEKAMSNVTDEKYYKYIPINNDLIEFLREKGYENKKTTSDYILFPDRKVKNITIMNDLSKGFTHYRNMAKIKKEVSFGDLRKTYLSWVNAVMHKETGILSSHSTHEVLQTFYLDPKILSTIEEAALKIQVFGT
jgi:site-specific recombinase XerD